MDYEITKILSDMETLKGYLALLGSEREIEAYDRASILAYLRCAKDALVGAKIAAKVALEVQKIKQPAS